MLSYIYSLDLLHNELDSMFVVKDYQYVISEVMGLPPKRMSKGCCSHWIFLTESGRVFLWTSSMDYLGVEEEMRIFVSLSTD